MDFSWSLWVADEYGILDTKKWKWKEAIGLSTGKRRLWHTGVTVNKTLYVYGGCESNILQHTLDRVRAR